MSARAATHSRSAGLLFRCHFGWPVREKRAVPMRCAADGLVSSSFHFLSLAAASAANRRQASKNGSIQQTQARPFHTHFTYTHNSRRIQISQLPAAQIYIYTCYFIQTFNQTPSFKLFPPQSKKKGKVFYCHCSDSRETISEENKTFAGCIFYRTCSAIPFGQVTRSNIVQFTLR